MPTRISKDNFEKEVLQADKTVLADFYSDSCVPCKRLSPVLFALEEEYAEKLKIVKININFDSELAEKYEVQAAPTLVFFKNGAEISRLRGAVKQAEIKEVTSEEAAAGDKACLLKAADGKVPERADSSGGVPEKRSGRESDRRHPGGDRSGAEHAPAGE